MIMFSEQAFLNAGPLIARSIQGAVAAGYIFNVLMIARAPLQLFQAISTSILPHLTSLHTSSEEGSDREFNRTVRMVLMGIAAFTALAFVVIGIAGPKLMQIAFSKKFTYDRAGLLLVTVGMGLYLARSPSTRPASRRARFAGRRPAGSAARFFSSPGTSYRWSPTSFAGSSSASSSPRAFCWGSSSSSTAAPRSAPKTCPNSAPRRNSRSAWPRSMRTSELGLPRGGGNSQRRPGRIGGARDRRAGDKERGTGVRHPGHGAWIDATVDLDRGGAEDRAEATELLDRGLR